MASARRKSAAIALAVVGIAGLSLASAATLNVNGGTIQAGATVDATCDLTGVDVKFTSGWAASAYNVTAVTVSGIDQACIDEGTSVGVNVTGATTQAPAELPAAASVTFPITGAASAIGQVAVVIHN